MKSIKTLTILIVLSFAVSFLYAQDTTEDTGGSALTESQKVNNDGAGATVERKVMDVSGNADSVKEDKSVSEDKTKIDNAKRTVLKKTRAISEVKKEDTFKAEEDNSSSDNLLLPINEGNYKYKRIPDIKLVEKSLSMAEPNMENNGNQLTESVVSDSSEGSGFFGLSKKTADIVAKGGILLLILVIFILYKVRSRGPGRRSSGRSVMNSYRK